MKVLVTGANGQLGKTIEELYLNNDEGIEFVFTSKSRLDITDVNSVQNIFKIKQFDYCINCAAYTDVEQAEKTPETAFNVNTEGVKNLAKACKEFGTILIHISTDYVFDGDKEGGYTINDIPNPINEYGKSKLQGEKYIQDILECYFIIRTSWLYSKKYGRNFYTKILEKAETETQINVTSNQIGCPTDTVNLARFIYRLINSPLSKYGIYHFCDSKQMTWYDFAKVILVENRKLFNINLVIDDEYLTFAKRPLNSVLQVTIN